MSRRRGSQVIVIHPGSRYLRIGRASDVNPVTVPCVVARRAKGPFTVPERVRLVSYPRTQEEAEKKDSMQQDDPVSPVIYASASSLNQFL